jgi:hypothetical protein
MQYLGRIHRMLTPPDLLVAAELPDPLVSFPKLEDGAALICTYASGKKVDRAMLCESVGDIEKVLATNPDEQFNWYTVNPLSRLALYEE